MWTIVAYGSDGGVVALMATSCELMASRMMDRLSDEPNVITVIATRRNGAWSVARPTPEPDGVVIIEGRGLWRTLDREELPSILKRQWD